MTGVCSASGEGLAANHLHVSRLQIYFFRANYLVACVLSYAVAFARYPAALLAVALLTLAALACNNSSAATLNDRLLWLVRRIHPPTALRIRARTMAGATPLAVSATSVL
jgi:hypothetical protein